jgi:hypothetical protein
MKGGGNMEPIHEELQELLKAFVGNDSENERLKNKRLIGEEFTVSSASVQRWIDGKNFPHPLYAQRIVNFLKDKLKSRLNAG